MSLTTEQRVTKLEAEVSNITLLLQSLLSKIDNAADSSTVRQLNTTLQELINDLSTRVTTLESQFDTLSTIVGDE